MSKNLQTVQKIYELFATQDVPGIMELLAENVAWEQWNNNYASEQGVPWMQYRQGKEGVGAFFQSLGAIQLTGFNVRSLMEGGHQIAAEVEISFNVPATGKLVHDEEIHLWTFNEKGEVSRLRHYNDTAKHIFSMQP